MSPKPTQSIQFRLLIASSLLIISSVAFLTYVNISRETASIKKGLESTARLVVNIIEISIDDDLYYNDSDQIGDTLKAIIKYEKSVSSGKVYSEKGILISDAFSDKVTYSVTPDPVAVDVLSREGFTYTLERKELIAAKAIWVGRKPIGVIRVGLLTKPIDEKIWTLTFEGTLIALVSVILSILVFYVLSLEILHPLRRLHEAVGKMSEGDYSSAIDVGRNDEIGTLSRAFNRMQARLKDSYLKLMDSEERYALALQGTNDGIWDWDLVSGKIYYSPRWYEIFDLPATPSNGSIDLWFRNIHPDDRQRFNAELDAYVAGSSESFETEYRIERPGKEVRWVFSSGCAVRDPETQSCLRVVGCITDITDKKSFELELERHALFDPLTSLPNRRMLVDKLNHSISKFEHDKRFLFAVIFLDFDGFKNVNDTFGHAAGDLLLKAISKRLTECVRPMDFISRVGGDEFVVILNGLKSTDMVETAVSRIKARVEEEFVFSDHSIFVSVSMGIVTSTADFKDAEELLQNADTAMYCAKISGKAQHCYFDGTMKNQAREKWKLINELHKAIEKDELIVYYHPIMKNGGRSIYGFEALLRWNHPERGFVPPDLFIPAAEESGFITEITRWVMDEVCRFCRSFPHDGGLHFFVNISARDFLVPGGVVETVKKSLEKTGCSPELLGLEVTERTLIGNFDLVRGQLLELKQMGIGIELDDFGTGYSSLSYLHQFPLSGIKIDKSFVDTVTEKKISENIVHGLIAMAHSLGLSVVAEGIELSGQLDNLSRAGCDYYQGYYFAKPLAGDDVMDFVLSLENGAGSNPLQKVCTA